MRSEWPINFSLLVNTVYTLIGIAILGLCPNFVWAYDYPEIAVEPRHEEVIELARKASDFLNKAPNPFDQRIQVSPEKLAHEMRLAELGEHCEDLWKETCSKEIGYDPTGYVLNPKNPNFDMLMPGFVKLMMPQMMPLIDFLIANDYDYSRKIKYLAYPADPELFKSCIAEYMVQQIFSDRGGYPLACLEGKNMHKFREAIDIDDSIYFVNRVRRVFRSKFTISNEMYQIEKIIFPRVRDLIVSKIEKYVTNKALASLILHKLDVVKFLPKDCHYLGVDNASYNPITNKFTVCYGQMLRNRSEFAKVSVIAHELGHAFDPAALVEGDYNGFKYSDPSNFESVIKEYPLGSVLQCLAKQESVGAKMLTEPADIMKSQFGESMSDVVAADILPEYMKLYAKDRVRTVGEFRTGIANVWKSVCTIANSRTETRASNKNVHPILSDRVNFILGANPKVREWMKCEQITTPASCSIER